MDPRADGDDRKFDVRLLDHAGDIPGWYRSRQFDCREVAPCAGLRLLGLDTTGRRRRGILFLVGYLVAPYILIALLKALSYTFPAVMTSQFLLCASLDDFLHGLHGRGDADGKSDLFQQAYSSRPQHRQCVLGEYARRDCRIARCRVCVRAAAGN